MVHIIIVSHSEKLAEGVVEINKQMSPAASIYACGGLENHELGTSLEKVMDVINELPMEDEILILCDIGSSKMVAESAIEFCDVADRCQISSAALVEGSLVACVSASLDKSLKDIAIDLEELELNK